MPTWLFGNHALERVDDGRTRSESAAARGNETIVCDDFITTLGRIRVHVDARAWTCGSTKAGVPLEGGP
jgi:hypothetical protein